MTRSSPSAHGCALKSVRGGGGFIFVESPKAVPGSIFFRQLFPIPTEIQMIERQDCITLNKAALADVVVTKVEGLDRQAAKVLVEEFFEMIAHHLEQGDTVKIPGLGNFSVRQKVARPGRNLKTGETVTISERRVVTFHPSGTLNARVTANLIRDKEPEAEAEAEAAGTAE